jgi:hypothetical protein
MLNTVFTGSFPTSDGPVNSISDVVNNYDLAINGDDIPTDWFKDADVPGISPSLHLAEASLAVELSVISNLPGNDPSAWQKPSTQLSSSLSEIVSDCGAAPWNQNLISVVSNLGVS